MIITISRQFAAGGAEVARRVADALDWRFVDNELIDRVAARSGLPPEAVAQREERAPGFIERLIRALARSVPELFPKASETVPEPEEAALVRVTESVVAELAAEGRVVLVGRAGPAVLRGGASHDALHVKLVAATPIRLAAAMARLGLDRKEAEKVLQQTDANRSRYLKQHYGRDWEDPAYYDLLLNTGSLGLDGAAEIIVGCARRRWRVSGKPER